MGKTDTQMDFDFCVVGVGGAGVNIIRQLTEQRLLRMKPVIVSTDAQMMAVSMSTIPHQVLLDDGRGRFESTEGKSIFCRQRAEEMESKIAELLCGAQAVIIVAGMGGGTSMGAAPVIARIARKTGALAIGIVTRPLPFEGKNRMKSAEESIRRLAPKLHSLMVFPGERIMAKAKNPIDSITELFYEWDHVMCEGIRLIMEHIHHIKIASAAVNEVQDVSREVAGLADFAVFTSSEAPT